MSNISVIDCFSKLQTGRTKNDRWDDQNTFISVLPMSGDLVTKRIAASDFRGFSGRAHDMKSA